MFRGTRLVVREPLRQSKADLSRAKHTFLFHFDVCDKSAEWWDLCKTLCLGEKPLRRKRQSIAYPKTHEREHPIGHPVLGSYPSSALLPLSPGERVPLAHRGKQCLANRPQDITQLVMPLDDESSSSTHHGMIHRKSISANTKEGVSAMCQS